MPSLRCVLAAGALVVVGLGGCGTDDADEAAGDAPSAAAPGSSTAAGCAAGEAVPTPARLRGLLDLGDLVAWDAVQVDDAAVNAAGAARDTSVAAVLDAVEEAAADAGWSVFSLDDEGFEAELLARDGAGVLLGVRLREGACPAEVLVAVSVTDYTATG